MGCVFFPVLWLYDACFLLLGIVCLFIRNFFFWGGEGVVVSKFDKLMREENIMYISPKHATEHTCI